MSEEMHWHFVIAAYVVTALGLGGLIALVTVRLRRWEKRAKDEGGA